MLAFIIMRTTRMCGNNLWNRRRQLESQDSSCPCSREILCETTATRQVTEKPFIHTAGFYIDIFC